MALKKENIPKGFMKKSEKPLQAPSKAAFGGALAKKKEKEKEAIKKLKGLKK